MPTIQHDRCEMPHNVNCQHLDGFAVHQEATHRRRQPSTHRLGPLHPALDSSPSSLSRSGTMCKPRSMTISSHKFAATQRQHILLQCGTLLIFHSGRAHCFHVRLGITHPSLSSRITGLRVSPPAKLP